MSTPTEEMGFAIFWGLHRVEGELANAEPVVPRSMLKPGQEQRYYQPPIPYVFRARAIQIPHLGRTPEKTMVDLTEVTFHHADRDELFIHATTTLSRQYLALGSGKLHVLLELDQGTCRRVVLNGEMVQFDDPQPQAMSPPFAEGELGIMCYRGQIVLAEFSIKPSILE